jgi:radical SAM superfamily enzyme YgiQ (UPF0313 family)
MIDLCLIDPETRANKNVPNIGLAYISACLQKMKIDHRIIDQDIMPFPLKRYMKIEAQKYGISVKSNTYRKAQEIVKDLGGSKNIIWGGPQVRDAPERCKRENPEVSEFIEGYYDYFGYKPQPENLDDIPFPRYDSFDSKYYLSDSFQTGVTPYPIITSRGCPYRCIFCASDKHFKFRSPRNCLEELIFARKRYNIKSFQVLDDNFILLPERAVEICKLIKSLKLTWFCHNGIRADQLTLEIAQSMKEAGCIHISVGIESSDPEVLRISKKGETIEQIEQAIRVAQQVGMSVNGFFIIGLPGSSYEKDIKSWEWAKKMNIRSHFGILVPMEGSELYERYKENITGDPIDGLFYDDRGEMNCVYETPDYPANKRIELYNKIMGGRRI